MPRNTERRKKTMTTGGLSRERLDRMHDVLANHVAGGRMPGLVALVSRRGETHIEAIGSMAFGNSRPMRRDTIFRIASITKPITAAAAMILVEECQLRLDDPVDPWLPELADRKVLRTVESRLDDTVPASRPISLRDLLTFRLGYGAIMVWPPAYPIQNAMIDAGISPSANLPTLAPDELMMAYGSLPLAHQPGEKWLYNSGSDILGVLIARVSGNTLGMFLRERIFEPLGMKDTGFSVPPKKIDRLPTCYQTDFSNGETIVFDEAVGGRFAAPPAFESGAGGLVTTVDDYLAFCRMMLSNGTSEGGRILSRPSVALMTANQLTPEQMADPNFTAIAGTDRGWGFGMAVLTRRNGLAGGPGRFGWDGGYGTTAYTDPQEELIGILLTQRLMESPAPPPVFQDFWTSAYRSVDG
jgi:CubicO group peptidase (beta-lactamase class C family)